MIKCFAILVLVFTLGACKKVPVEPPIVSLDINDNDDNIVLVDNTEHTGVIIRPEGYDDMDIFDKYWVDVEYTSEFKEMKTQYEMAFGALPKYAIPKTETYGSLKEKVEKAITEGYDDIIPMVV